MENATIAIKSSLSRQILTKTEKFSSKITFLHRTEWAKKPFHATVPEEVISLLILEDIMWSITDYRPDHWAQAQFGQR